MTRTQFRVTVVPGLGRGLELNMQAHYDGGSHHMSLSFWCEYEYEPP